MLKRLLILLALVAALGGNPAPAADMQIHSKWDANLLTVDLGPVAIDGQTMDAAWEQMGGKYLLRANLYMDAAANADKKPFTFHKEKATGQELLDAFLKNYPALTYTQSPQTGVIWIHPKAVNYTDILNQGIAIPRAAIQVPMYWDVYVPLLKLLAPNVIDERDDEEITFMGILDPVTLKPPITPINSYGVDLPAGIYSARQILDFCCVANPSRAFLVQPKRLHPQTLVLWQKRLLGNGDSQLANEAVRFWELNIGNPADGMPSFEEVRGAMSDPAPEKRAAAKRFVEASIYNVKADRNYSPINLISGVDGSEQEVWAALGMGDIVWRGQNLIFSDHLMGAFPGLGTAIMRIRSPNLALLASLELTVDGNESSFLNDLAREHTYSEAEIASIRPELYRLARSSKAVRDKLSAMKSPVPELSPESLHELENTNFFTLAPNGG